MNRGEQPDRNAVAASNPVGVVEATSPGTRSVDTGHKLTGRFRVGHFRVPSIMRCLAVLKERRITTHHACREDDGIETRMVALKRV